MTMPEHRPDKKQNGSAGLPAAAGAERGRHELLAPAGSFETAKAVIAAGADAVYLAGPYFGARAYAANLQTEELLSVIDYAHLYGRQIHLTVNTLLKNKEIQSVLYDFICPLYRQGLDAVIVQDFGVLRFLKQNFPDLTLHASTQMSVASAAGAAFLHKAGASRIIAARELLLSEIRSITEHTDIEVESFIHGALCYSFSGQCLLSSMIGGRSGNRGRCAQPCRLPYRVEDGDGRLYNKNADYPLSPKDLCALDLLPQLCEAGVCSFKIEGRMKQAGYAAGVTAVYRRYLDLYESDPQKFAVAKEDRRLLSELGSRSGFTKGYYVQRNGRDMLADRDSSFKTGADASGRQPVADARGQLTDAGAPGRKKDAGAPGQQPGADAPARREPAKLPVRLRCSIRPGEPISLEARLKESGIGVTVSGETAQAAQSRPLTAEDVCKRLKKAGDTPFTVVGIDLDLDGESFLPVRAVNEARRKALSGLEEKILRGYRRGEPAAVSSAVSHHPRTDSKHAKTRVMIAKKRMLDAVLQFACVDEVLLDLQGEVSDEELCGLADQIRAAGKKAVYCFPYIFRSDLQQKFDRSGRFAGAFDGFLARSFDSLGFALDVLKLEPERMCTDYSLSVFSENTAQAYGAPGPGGGTVSPELNKKELLHQDPSLELVIYGLQPVMISAQCIYKNYSGCRKHTGNTDMLTLREADTGRGRSTYTVLADCASCCNVIYAGRPLYLLDQGEELKRMGFASYRLSFVRESGQEIRQILSDYQRMRHGETVTLPVSAAEFGEYYTRGHYNRGVE